MVRCEISLVQEVITAHIDALAAHVEELLPILRYMLLLGEGPVTPERLASALRLVRQLLPA